MTGLVPIARRGFLAGSAATVAATSLAGAPTLSRAQEVKPLPGYVAWKDAGAVIVHSDQTIETRRAHTAGLITPEDKLYIRNNVKAPDASFVADRDGWQVEVAGVKAPRTLTVAELKGLGLATVAAVLQCSGNGRSYMQEKVKGTEHKINGTPWTVGAAGCVLWTGVPLKAVADALGGVTEGAKFITSIGGEKLPEGLNPKDVMVERSVPSANLETALLAWEMNGKPLSLAHGGPLRIIIPGYSGVNSVKYVRRIAFTEAETDAKIQKSSYRMHPPGVKAAPEQPSIWEMEVKSWITAPLEGARAGRVVISGVAFGGMNPVAGVEVSVDGGKSWEKAAFVGPDLGRFAWRQFALARELAPGSYTLASRATDSRGNSQPEEVEPNGGGYGHNGWKAPAVALTVA